MSDHGDDEHAFSIEMRSKDCLSNVCISNKASEPVLIQGELGVIEEICFPEGVHLEIRGSKGIFRLDVDRQEFEKQVRKATKSGKY